MKHTYEIRVPSFLCRPDDRLGFDGMASIFQEAAWEHAHRLGVDFTEEDTPVYWVLHRLGIRFVRRPQWGERLVVTTWPSRIVRLYAMREFVVENDKGEMLAQASSAWIVLDGTSGRPVRPERRLAREWAVNEVPLPVPTGKTEAISDPATILTGATWDRVRPSDTDRNAHVNNGRYAQWLSDWAPGVVKPDDPDTLGLLTFTAETRIGQEFTVLSRHGGGSTDGSTVAEVWVKEGGADPASAVCACRFNRIPHE